MTDADPNVLLMCGLVRRIDAVNYTRRLLNIKDMVRSDVSYCYIYDTPRPLFSNSLNDFLR